MIPLASAAEFSPFEHLAARIRSSSNFRVAWQLFRCDAPCRATPRAARQILETTCAVPEFHLFLAPDAQSQPAGVPRLHEHCILEPASGPFESIVARAAADRLGAYSRSLREATSEEADAVRELFNRHGSYTPFELLPGKVPGCASCKEHNGHLFSDWFYAVAWDWCYCVIWEEAKLALLWCMSDTD